jgi:hypothetical protein
MNEFTEKYKAALKNLEKFYQTNLERIKDIEKEKTCFLTVRRCIMS